MTESALELTSAEEDALYKRGLSDPAWWIEDVLGGHPWAGQAEIAEAVRDHKEVAVKSCNSAGKTWDAARLILWFLYAHYPSKVITTAPTDRQVKYQLWQELRYAHANSVKPLGGSPLLEELTIEDEWFALGFAAKEYDPTRFQGFHSPNILVVVDEAAGVTEAVFEGLESILAGGNARLLMIGNPTDPNSHFAGAFKSAGVKKITISAWDTPNFKHFGITQDDIATGAWQQKIGDSSLPAPHLITPEWVERHYKRRGPKSPYWISRINAQFPAQSEDSLISLTHVEQAQNRTLEPGEPNELGVDVARFGSNETVAYQRRGPVARLVFSYRGRDTMETVGHIIRALRSTGATVAKVDADGLGAGVVDRLVELDEPVEEYHGGATPIEPAFSINKRAESFWNLRDIFEEGSIDIDPDDDELAAQLCSIKWKPDSRGRVTIEKKEDMEKRGLASPDRADALAEAYAPTARDPGDHGVTI